MRLVKLGLSVVLVIVALLMPVMVSASTAPTWPLVITAEYDNTTQSISSMAYALVDEFGDYFPYYITYEHIATQGGYIILAKDIEIHTLTYDVENDRITMTATLTGAVTYSFSVENGQWTMRYSTANNWDFTAPARVSSLFTNGRNTGTIESNPYGMGSRWLAYDQALISASASGYEAIGDLNQQIAVLITQNADNHTALMAVLNDIAYDVHGFWNSFLTYWNQWISHKTEVENDLETMAALLSEVFKETEVTSAARDWLDTVVEENIDQATEVGDSVQNAADSSVIGDGQTEVLNSFLAFPPELVSILLCGITCIVVVFGVKKGMS